MTQAEPGIHPLERVDGFASTTIRRVPSSDGTTLQVYDSAGSVNDHESGVRHRAFMSHATGFCAGAWAAVLAEIGDIAWTAWDYRGHGRSGGGRVPVSWWDMGADAGAVRDLTPAVRAVGVGHSMGGAALLMAQLVDPSRFDALILFEPIVVPPPFQRVPDIPLAQIARRRRGSFASQHEALENYADKAAFRSWDRRALEGYVAGGFTAEDGGEVHLACQPRFESEVFTASGAHALVERLSEIHIPTYVLAGAETDTYPLEWPRELAARMPEGVFETIDATGHFAPMDQPVALAAMIDDVVGG